jgi:signal recognition particle receptor subunit beta
MAAVHTAYQQTGSSTVEAIASTTERMAFWEGAIDPQGAVPAQVHCYTVSGSVLYDTSCIRLLMGVDGLIFVADSAPDKLAANVAYLNRLAMLLQSLRRDLRSLPLVLQYNKRDIRRAMPVATLDRYLNSAQWPRVETIATTGQGVHEAFNTLCMQLKHPAYRPGKNTRE